MQKSIESKVLSLFLTLLLILGVFGAVQIASPVASAKTVGGYEITFATDGTTGNERNTDSINGIDATAAIGNNVYTKLARNEDQYSPNYGGFEMMDFVDITISFSGTTTDSGYFDVFLHGIAALGWMGMGMFDSGDGLYVRSGQSIPTITIPVNMTENGNISDLYLELDFYDMPVHKLNLPISKSINGDTISVTSPGVGEYNDLMGEGERADLYYESTGTPSAAGTYTFTLSSVKAGYSFTATVETQVDYVDLNYLGSPEFVMPAFDVDDFILNVTFTPSGGSGGSSGGSSSSNKSPAASRPDGSTTSSSQSTGNASSTSSNVSANGSVSSTAVKSDLQSALTKAGANGTAKVTVKNAESISTSTLKTLAADAQKAGKNVVLNADTTDANGNIQGRLYVEPAKLTGLNGDLKLSVYTDPAKTAATKNAFEKFFNNNVAVVKCEQQGSFGASLKMAVKLDLSKLDTKSLVFYSHDPKTNSFSQIPNTAYSIDKNGYLSFTTDKGNNIIITDKPLKKK